MSADFCQEILKQLHSTYLQRLASYSSLEMTSLHTECSAPDEDAPPKYSCGDFSKPIHSVAMSCRPADMQTDRDLSHPLQGCPQFISIPHLILHKELSYVRKYVFQVLVRILRLVAHIFHPTGVQTPPLQCLRYRPDVQVCCEIECVRYVIYARQQQLIECS